MGKKKKGNKVSQSRSGPTVAQEQEEEEGSERWLEQQRRLLAQFESKAQTEQREGTVTSSSIGHDCGQEVRNSSSAVTDDADQVFAVRRVSFFDRQVPVLLQNRNGPCALLAVANGMLLRGTLQLADDEHFMTSKDLVTRLADLCQTLNAKKILEDPNASAAVREIIERLPKFLDGLFLNCRFGSCSDFEYTADLALFDYFNLQLFHAWVEPEVAAIANSWNVLAETLGVCAEIRCNLENERRPPTANEGEKLAQAVWLEEWLEETRSQATEQGMRALLAVVREQEVCVLFRNNHFSTIFKPRAEALCALLTDVSFEFSTSAVWESLEADFMGAGAILDGDFRPSSGAEMDGRAQASNAGHNAAMTRLINKVTELGFTLDQAEAALEVVNWSSAEEAVEAILDGSAESSRGGARVASSPSRTGNSRHICPACGKEFKSLNGLLNHRAAKGH